MCLQIGMHDAIAPAFLRKVKPPVGDLHERFVMGGAVLGAGGHADRHRERNLIGIGHGVVEHAPRGSEHERGVVGGRHQHPAIDRCSCDPQQVGPEARGTLLGERAIAEIDDVTITV